MGWRTPAKYVFGLVLAGALLYLVFRNSDPEAIGAQLRGASPGLLAAAVAAMLSHNLFRVWRWGSLLAPVREGVPFRPMFSAVMLGYLVTWAVPGRLGELVRPAYLAGRERLPMGPCLGSCVSDRLLDSLAVVVLFFVGTLVTPLGPEAAGNAAVYRSASLVLFLGVVIVFVVLMFASSLRSRIDPWLSRRSRLIQWLGNSFFAVGKGTEALRNPRLAFPLMFHTIAMWMLIALGTWLGIRACHVPIPFGGALMILLLLVAGIALPTPGGAGGYHAMMTLGLTGLFDVDPSVAAGTSILVHLVVVVPVMATGVVLLLVERVGLADLVQMARQVKHLDAAEPSR